jgi:hypothetical protein
MWAKTKCRSGPNQLAKHTYDGRSINNAQSGNLFVVKVQPDGQSENFFYYSSNGEDKPNGLAIGPATGNRAWITGKTCGDGFPTTDGVLHRMSHCGVFVLVLENSGVQDVGMVFGGLDGNDEATAIVPNGPNSAYIAGTVESTAFPVTSGAFQISKIPGAYGFVTQVDTTLPAGKIVHSTLFGNEGSTLGYSIANADGKGVYLAGMTTSSQLPFAPAPATKLPNGFVTRFSVDLSKVSYTQTLQQAVFGIALQNPVPGNPIIYATGEATPDNEDAYMAKIDDGTPASNVTDAPAETTDNSPYHIPATVTGGDVVVHP